MKREARDIGSPAKVTVTLQDLLPETEFRLFAVCARYPQQLAQQVELTRLREGVYEVRELGLVIRVIVVSQLPQAEQRRRGLRRLRRANTAARDGRATAQHP